MEQKRERQGRGTKGMRGGGKGSKEEDKRRKDVREGERERVKTKGESKGAVGKKK